MIDEKIIATFKNSKNEVTKSISSTESVTLGTNANSSFVIESDKILETHLKLYKEGQSFFLKVFSSTDSKKRCSKVWRKLYDTESYCLTPEDIIRIGKLSLLVQRFNVGIIADIGTRPMMEDLNKIVHDLKICDDIHCSFFSVFDGHEGEYCAKFLVYNLHAILKRIFEKEILEALNINIAVSKALSKAIKESDKLFNETSKDMAFFSGSTISLVVILGSRIYCANVGDSRAVLSKKGIAYNLSKDHKATNPQEEKRIIAAGGEVKCGRVMGKIAISRAMGDFKYKENPLIICDPEIRVWDINPNEDEFIVMGSDGLFDKFSSQEAVYAYNS